MKKLTLAMTLLTLGLLGADKPEAMRWNFEEAKVGELPKDWSSAKTGEGQGSVWKVQEDETAPAGLKVLTQTSSAGPNGLFNLCVADKSRFGDVDLSVSMKALTGKLDQGGGLVWRYQDAKNYYVTRLNPLEGDFRLFKVIDGKRTQIGATVKTDEPIGKWHTIRVVHRGSRIQCSLSGKVRIEEQDDALKEPGKIGLWSKADAVSSFDDVSASTLAALSHAAEQTLPSPQHVLVVNTQDASVSVVDLATMKELNRFPVGPRPYGIAVLQDGQTVAVGVEDEEKVKFFSLPDFKVKGEVHIGKMFNDHILLTSDGQQLLVADFYSDKVFAIDAATMKDTSPIEGCSAPHVVKYGPLKKNAYVTCKKITGIAIVDPLSKQVLKFHQLNVNPRSLTFSPDESKVYFGSFWVNGFFEMDTETGKVTRLFACDPPADNNAPQEVTYHGVEAVGAHIVLAANEGRSYVDSVDVATGKLLDRLSDVSKPCCIERIPGSEAAPTRVLVSNIGDGTLQMVEVAASGKLKLLGKAQVGKAPKRVAFVQNGVR